MNSWRNCTICDYPFDNDKDEKILVREKGLNALIKISMLLKDNRWKVWTNKNSVAFHVKCRKNYVLISKSSSPVPSTPLAPSTLLPAILTIHNYRTTSNGCTFCDRPLNNDNDNEETIVLSKKDLQTLIVHSMKKQDYKWKHWDNKENVIFHVKCKERYTASIIPSKSPPLADHQALFSNWLEGKKFNFLDMCLFCTKHFHDTNIPVSTLKTDTLKDRLIIAAERADCPALLQILKATDSLVDAGARYHRKCYTKFSYTPSVNRRGRPKRQDLEKGFSAVCNLIECNKGCQFRLSALHDVLGEYIPVNKTLSTRLKFKYGADIEINEDDKDYVISYKRQSNDCYTPKQLPPLFWVP